MKLRQKLAVVLASAMAVTAVPVVTMAASDNGMLREVLKVEKNTPFMDYTTAGGIQIKLKDAWQESEEVFYLTLSNAKFDAATRLRIVQTVSNPSATEAKTGVEYDLQNAYYNENGIATGELVVKDGGSAANNGLAIGTILFDGDYTIKIKLKKQVATANAIFQFPLLAKVTGGDAKVKLEKSGSTSTLTDGEWTFATTSEKKLNFTAADPEVIYETGNLAAVTFSENFSGAFQNSEVAYIQYEIQDADYVFDFNGGTTVKGVDGKDTDTRYTKYTINSSTYVERAYGFAGINYNTISVEAYVSQEDEGICVFKITAPTNASDSIGKIKLKNIPVRNDEKDIEEGDLLVDITNFGNGTVDLLGNGSQDVKLGKVVAYSTYIEMTDKKPVEVVAGRTEAIEFTLGENIDDSIVGDRELEIVLDKDAHFDYTTGATLYAYNYVNDTTTGTDKGIVKSQTSYKLNTSDANEIKLIESIKVDKEDSNKLIVKLNPKAQINGKKDSFKLKLNVCVPVDNKEEEKITITASGRALENECSTTAITIKNPFDVKMEEMRVKVGLQNQVGGKVTITETDKAMFMKGNMNLSVVDPATGKPVAGIKFYGKDFVTYETSADIKKADLQAVNIDGAASIKINRQSKAASTIDLSDFHVTVDRTVPEGKYDLVLSGTAVDDRGHDLTIKDFFVVGTPNTEDITSNGLRRGTATFVINESKYVANGTEYTMDAASYIQDPGFTMVPVRYVAEAFGVAGKDILFSNGTATIFAGERTIQLTSGSDIAIVNGASIKMGTKVVIKDNRTYAPIGELATILGIKKDWTAETKTATFINE